MTEVDFTEVMAGLPKATRDRFKKASEISLDRLPMGSVQLTKALGGGIGYGRQTLIWGNKSSGKTSLVLQAMADAQKQGKTCAIIDAEKTFDTEWAARIGVDTDKLYVAKLDLARDMADAAVDLVKAGVDILMIDSISALVPMSWVEDDELKGMDGTKQIGSKSKDIGTMMNMVNLVNEKTAFICISQMRNKIGHVTFGQPDGGHAAKFFSTTVIKTTSSAAERDQIKGKVFQNGGVTEALIGRPVDWLVEFNKIGPPNRKGTYKFFYDGDFIGVDTIEEVIQVGSQMGVIEKSGNWFTIDGQQYNGSTKAAMAIREQPDLYERLVKEILG